MKTLAVHFGAWDHDTHTLVYHTYRRPQMTYKRYLGSFDVGRDVTPVDIEYVIKDDHTVGVRILSTFTGTVFDKDYDMDKHRQPERYRFLPHGAQYMRLYGYMVNTGDVTYPSIVKLKLPSHLDVWEWDDTIWYGERPIAAKNWRP